MRPATRWPAALVVAVLALAALATTARAQVPHETVFPGLDGAALVEALRAEAPPAVLSYDRVRDSMFTWEQRTFGRVRCVYTGYEITISLAPGMDASTQAFQQSVNTEHAWPQSHGTGTGPARSDLHHLFPTRAGVNSARSNLPFGESPDHLTSRWYRLDESQATIPTVFLDEWSERLGQTLWEPREDQKGNAARAVLYVAMRYPDVWQGFLDGALATLVAWNEADPVDAAEWLRMEYTHTLQGNRNPFVVDPTLARRAFLGGTVADAPGPTATGFSVQVAPNPAAASATITVGAGVSTVVVTDALGREIWRGERVRGSVQVPVQTWAPGLYTVQATPDGSSGKPVIPGRARLAVVR